MPLQKNQTLSLSIDSISSDGNGVGRYEGMVVFVPGAAVGDVLWIKIVKVAKSHAYGRIERIAAPSPGRQELDCPIGDRCGGCCFRHLTYRAELVAKHTFVADALTRLGRLSIVPLPVLPSPSSARYRNKVQYPVALSADGGLSYGFYANRSHRVIPCRDCLLQTQLVNQLARRVVQLLNAQGATAYDEATRRGLVRHITLRQGAHSGQILVCLVLNGDRLPDNAAFVSQLISECPQVTTVVLNRNQENTNVIHGRQSTPIYGAGYIEDTLCGVPMRLNEHTFAQVNTLAAEELFALVRQFAAPTAETTLLDLYCGTGVIGLSMAAECKSLIGVEVVAEAVESARRSAAEMGLSNARFLCSDAGRAASQLAQEGVRPDIVVLDPPRKGVSDEALQAILKMSPARIVMVSCNPATMARDLAVLAAAGYKPQVVQPVDLFPRTRHVEVVVLLSRCPNSDRPQGEY